MKKILLFFPLLWCLSACAQPLPPSAYTPANPDFYKDMPERYYLKGRVAMGEAVNSYDPKGRVTGAAYGEALAHVLGESPACWPRAGPPISSMPKSWITAGPPAALPMWRAARR